MKTLCRHLVIASLAASTCLLGCAGPTRDPVGKQVYTAWVKDMEGKRTPYDGIDSTAAARNNFIFRMKAVKDYEYGNYVANLRRETSWGETASDVAKLGLDSAVALTGGVGLKAALGAASAGVTGATTSVKKNVLFDQSITTFITKMDALRLEKYNDILTKMKPDHTPPYTVAEAYDDLQEYGRRGKLEAALADVDAKAGAQKAEEKKENDKLQNTSNLKEPTQKESTNPTKAPIDAARSNAASP